MEKLCLWAMLSLSAATPSFAQQAYTEEQVTRLAKSFDVHTLDASLPSQRLEDWLQTGPPHARIRWDVADTCDNRPEPHYEYPLCAKVWFSGNGEAGSFLIEVGTKSKGLRGQPKLYNEILSWEDGPGWIMNGSAVKLSDLPGLLNQPPYAHSVAQLYDKVVAQHPIGIPSGAQMKAIQPLLSQRLSAQLQSAKACEADYSRQHPQESSKTHQPSWLKSGLFTGDGFRAAPASAWPVREGQEKDGSFLVQVNLFARNIDLGGGLKGGAASPTGTWHVQVRVIEEDGRFVVDDVRLFDGASTDGSSHLLSEAFAGCDGVRWTAQTATK